MSPDGKEHKIAVTHTYFKGFSAYFSGAKVLASSGAVGTIGAAADGAFRVGRAGVCA